MLGLLVVVLVSFLVPFFFVSGVVVSMLVGCIRIRNQIQRLYRVSISPQLLVKSFVVLLLVITSISFLVPWYLQYYEIIDIPEGDQMDLVRFPSSPRYITTKSVRFFFAIATTPEEFQQRFLVRKQMRELEKLGLSLDWRFYCGRTEQWSEFAGLVQAERNTFQDIVLLPGSEQYRALVQKMRTVFHVALQERLQWQYLVKLDGDVCMHPKLFIENLKNATRDDAEWLWAGQFEKTAQHVLDPSSTLYVPSHIWPADQPLPGFMHGPVYVVSRLLAKALADERMNPKVVYIGLEDVSIAISIAKNSTLKKAVRLRAVPNWLTFAEMWSSPLWLCSGNASAAHFFSRNSALNYRMCMQGRQRACNGLVLKEYVKNRH